MKIAVLDKTYRVLGIDFARAGGDQTAGVVMEVREDHRKKFVLGWSVGEEDGMSRVHVLEFGGEGEWRGFDLEETLTRALRHIQVPKLSPVVKAVQYRPPEAGDPSSECAACEGDGICITCFGSGGACADCAGTGHCLHCADPAWAEEARKDYAAENASGDTGCQ